MWNISSKNFSETQIFGSTFLILFQVQERVHWCVFAIVNSTASAQWTLPSKTSFYQTLEINEKANWVEWITLETRRKITSELTILHLGLPTGIQHQQLNLNLVDIVEYCSKYFWHWGGTVEQNERLAILFYCAKLFALPIANEQQGRTWCNVSKRCHKPN